MRRGGFISLFGGAAGRPQRVDCHGRIVELPSIKPRSTSRRQGLRKLSPDLISKARDETASQVTRFGLTFLGTAAFCLLSLLSPDSALLGGSERINVPLAGPVSFFGFMLLGPAVLIVLRVYLQIYVEHSDRLDRLARSVPVVRAPTLVPLQNSLMRLFSGLIFYTLLPVAMLLFAWKAAVFPAWGSGLFCVAVVVIASHGMLPFGRFSWRSFGRFSWRSKGLQIVTTAIIAGVLALGALRLPFDLFHANLSGLWLVKKVAGVLALGAPRRPFDLYHANLAGLWLANEDLSNANLSGANLSRADLSGANLLRANLRDANLRDANLFGAYLNPADLSDANLSGANLSRADLSGATLSGANLSGANLRGANLRDANQFAFGLKPADLSDANLSRADLSGANLPNVKNLTQTQLDDACGDANTKLPKGFEPLKPCSTN
jgi:uncharacterized protein YjbI with pentapeptide repeats